MSSCLFWDGFHRDQYHLYFCPFGPIRSFGWEEQTKTKVIRWCYAAGYVDSVQVGTRWPG